MNPPLLPPEKIPGPNPIPLLVGKKLVLLLLLNKEPELWWAPKTLKLFVLFMLSNHERLLGWLLLKILLVGETLILSYFIPELPNIDIGFCCWILLKILLLLSLLLNILKVLGLVLIPTIKRASLDEGLFLLLTT